MYCVMHAALTAWRRSSVGRWNLDGECIRAGIWTTVADDERADIAVFQHCLGYSHRRASNRCESVL